MKLPEKPALLEQAAKHLESWYDSIRSLPSVSLEALDPKTTALILVDMVNGFAREGAMASPRVGALVSPIAALAARCAEKGMEILAFADCHTPESLELETYPPHCLRGTGEAQVCRELLEAAPSMTVIEKNSTDGFLEPAFEAWRREHEAVRTYLVVGDCTDICVQQFALSSKAWHNTRNMALRVIVPVDLVDTFDADPHPADVYNLTALMTMAAAGAELAAHID